MNRKNTTIAWVGGGVLAGAIGAAMLTLSPGPTESRPEPPPAEATQSSAPASDEPNAQVATQSSRSGDEIIHDSDNLSFSATFPEAPEMRIVSIALQQEASTYLQRTQDEARDADASNAMPRWDVNIAWTTVATADNYASLIGRSNEYRGGAHPVQLVDTKLMKIEEGEELRQADFFSSREWPTPAVAIAVCEELKSVKRAAVGSATIFDEPIICAGPRNNIRLDEAKLAFAASQTGAGFGGLHVLYQPYVIGSYAEGGFEVTIPSEVFIEDVAKEHRALFTGDPVLLEN